jgi:hypothetical protein
MQSVQESGKWKGSKKENCSGNGGNFVSGIISTLCTLKNIIKKSHAGIFAYLR